MMSQRGDGSVYHGLAPNGRWAALCGFLMSAQGKMTCEIVREKACAEDPS